MHRDFFIDARKQLIVNLKQKGIDSESVLNAMLKVPREQFVPKALSKRAYEDISLPIDKQQTISQPFTVARMTSLLEVKKGDKILEIGTGSGYQAAILTELGAEVYTIERHFELHNQARILLSTLYPKQKIYSRYGDGTIGWSEYAPYAGIIVTAGAPEITQTLLHQLDIGGKLIIPVGDEKRQTMHCVIRQDESSYLDYPLDDYTFVPLIGKEGWKA